MIESLFHNGCIVTVLPLHSDNGKLSAVTIKGPVYVFYELRSSTYGSQYVSMQLHYYIHMCNSHLHEMVTYNK